MWFTAMEAQHWNWLSSPLLRTSWQWYRFMRGEETILPNGKLLVFGSTHNNGLSRELIPEQTFRQPLPLALLMQFHHLPFYTRCQAASEKPLGEEPHANTPSFVLGHLKKCIISQMFLWRIQNWDHFFQGIDCR